MTTFFVLLIASFPLRPDILLNRHLRRLHRDDLIGCYFKWWPIYFIPALLASGMIALLSPAHWSSPIFAVWAGSTFIIINSVMSAWGVKYDERRLVDKDIATESGKLSLWWCYLIMLVAAGVSLASLVYGTYRYFFG